MTKPLFAALLAVALLPGCAKLPAAVSHEVPLERVMTAHTLTSKVKQSAPAAPSLAGALVPGGATRAEATASGTTTATTVDGAPATLEIVTKPGGLRIIPVFASERDITSLRFSPADGQATWGVAPSWGEPTVGAIACTLTGDAGQAPTTFSLAPADLGWPKRFVKSQQVALPLATPAILAYLKANPEAKHLTLDALLQDEAGKPLLGKAGRAATLSLSLAVL